MDPIISSVLEAISRELSALMVKSQLMEPHALLVLLDSSVLLV